MTARGRVAAIGLAALALLAVGCSRTPPVRPDVVLVSLDALDWQALSIDDGPVQAPNLEALAKASARFETLATLAPGGAPAAATLLTGESPARHGLRRLGQGALAPDVATLADRLRARGWRTGAFLQANDISLSMQVDRGFEAWDSPPESFPTGHPGIATRRPLPDTVAAGLHWLRILDKKEPVFLWFHFPEPAPPSADAAERAQRLGELDRFLGNVRDRLAERGRLRGRAPILALVVLRGQRDLASAMEDAFLLREPALRVRAFVEDASLAPGEVKGLAGVDEIAALVMALAGGAGRGESTASRMLDLAQGSAEAREVVVAETMVPLTSVGAEPVKAGVRETMMAASTEEAIVQSVAADPTWPAGTSRVAASEMATTFLAIDSAWTDLQRGRAAEAVTSFRSLTGPDAGSAPQGARVGLALALLATGAPTEAAAEFARLEAESAQGELAWEQALLGQATALRASGDAVGARAMLERLALVAPRDVRVLSWLASAAAEAGDRRAAVDALLKLLELDPDHPDALESVGRLQLEAGQHALAAESFDQALRRRPTSSTLLALSARAHLAAGDGWTALDRVDRRVNLFGATTETDLGLADVYESAERWDLAAEFLKRALEKSPADTAIILRSAQIQLRRGDEEDARGLLTRARELMPASSEPCALLARWLEAAGRKDDAVAAESECAPK